MTSTSPDATSRGFEPLSVHELARVRRAKSGLVLVDHHARDHLKSSVLHSASCPWLGRANGMTPLRHGDDPGDVLRWLRSNRGPEGDGWKRCPGCNAQVAGAGSPVLPTYEPGELVEVAGVRREIATVRAQNGDAAVVATFVGPAGPERSATAALRNLTHFDPGPADNAWLDTDGAWRRVDIVKVDGGRALVYEGDRIAHVSVDDLRFREFGPLADPLGHLAAGFAGSLPAAEARRRFYEAYLALGTAAAGLDALLSAGVSLFPHQVGVVRRVLDDPVQRYLLADEVGLGKTIEAGLIIRQRLIDAPRSVVVVMVPSPLVPQWQDELNDHLGLRRFRNSGIEVVPYESLESWRRHITPDLVVVDEAHRVAAGWGSPIREHAERFEAAKKLTHEAARVLLLSATPVLHRELDLLGMLHLLDPDTFALDDLDGFKARIADREELGRLFLGLAPGTPSFLLDHPLAELRTRFPSDHRLVALIDAVDSDGDDKILEAAVANVRLHVSETYRLHSRMLRNRRVVITGGAYRVRGRAGHESFLDGDPRRPAVEDWLEGWRGALLQQAADVAEDWLPVYAEVFWCFVQAASGDLDCLRQLALYRTTRRLRHLEASGIDLAARGALKSVDLGDGARATLGRLLGLLGPEPDDDEEVAGKRRLAQACAGALGDATAVVFTSAFQTAEIVAEHLREMLSERVEVLGVGVTGQTRRDIVRDFRNGEVRVLVCDASSEEGLNLQEAEVVVHLDTPRVASRVEQRIGRADRHGGLANPVRNLVLGGEDGGFTAAWSTVLAEVFGVFDASTASALFAVEAVERRQHLEWFVDGVPPLEALDTGAMREAVEDEQRRIDRVDSLDALARQDSNDTLVVERIQRAEETHGEAIAQAVLEAGNVVAGGLDYEAVPDHPGRWQISFGRASAATKRHAALVGAKHVATTDRAVATRRPGVALLRPGEPIVETIREQLDWDEVTQTFAVWVRDPEGIRSLAVRTELLVHASPLSPLRVWRELEAERFSGREVRTEADAPLALAAIRRRLDAFLVPIQVVTWFSAGGAPIDDPAHVAELESRLVDPCASEHWGIEDVVTAGAAAGLATSARLLAELRVVAPALAIVRAAAVCSPAEAAAGARARWSPRARLLRLRAERAGGAAALREASAEEALNEALLEAIANPVATWNGAGVLVAQPD